MNGFKRRGRMSIFSLHHGHRRFARGVFQMRVR